jgi:hypothetical protein
MLFYLGLEVKETNFITQTKIQGFVLSYGLFSWLAYILLLVIAVMSPVPDTPIVIAGGYIFVLKTSEYDIDNLARLQSYFLFLYNYELTFKTPIDNVG